MVWVVVSGDFLNAAFKNMGFDKILRISQLSFFCFCFRRVLVTCTRVYSSRRRHHVTLAELNRPFLGETTFCDGTESL